MPFEVRLGRSAAKAYARLSGKLARGVDRCLAELEMEPTAGPDIKRLKGLAGCYRVQVGGFRILYEVDLEARIVWVYEIRPRGDVYKR
jgi:mRNA interferase RelE/StbE